MKKKAEFKKELKELLVKYNATISFSVSSCSDTHGLYEERIVIEHRTPGTFKDETLVSVDGWTVNASDLK